jgi:hypothetical protein
LRLVEVCRARHDRDGCAAPRSRSFLLFLWYLLWVLKGWNALCVWLLQLWVVWLVFRGCCVFGTKFEIFGVNNNSDARGTAPLHHRLTPHIATLHNTMKWN